MPSPINPWVKLQRLHVLECEHEGCECVAGTHVAYTRCTLDTRTRAGVGCPNAPKIRIIASSWRGAQRYRQLLDLELMQQVRCRDQTHEDHQIRAYIELHT